MSKLREQAFDAQRCHDGSKEAGSYFLCVKLEDAEAAVEEAKIEGIESVLTIRCMQHRGVGQLNSNESSGAECGACVADAVAPLKEYEL